MLKIVLLYKLKKENYLMIKSVCKYIKFNILKSKIKLKYFNFCKTLKSKKTVIFFLVFIQFLLLFLTTSEYISNEYKFMLYTVTFPIPLIILIILLFDTKNFKCLLEYIYGLNL